MQEIPEHSGEHCSAILIVGRQGLVRALVVEGLHRRIDDFEVIGCSWPGEADHEFGPLVGRDIRLVILHACAQDGDIVEAGHLLLGPKGLDAPRMLLTDGGDTALVTRALACGFKGVLSTATSIELAVAAIRLVLAGGVYVPTPIAELAQDANGGDPRHPSAAILGAERHSPEGDLLELGLTDRERRVLAELRRGHPNKIIARELNISENTAKMHVRRILAKLRVRNRTEAALLFQTRLDA